MQVCFSFMTSLCVLSLGSLLLCTPVCVDDDDVKRSVGSSGEKFMWFSVRMCSFLWAHMSTGVTNPIFVEQTGWWDVLCDVGSGKVVINPKCSQLSKDMDQCREFDAECYSQVWSPTASVVVTGSMRMCCCS